jgi:hypothetical protein
MFMISFFVVAALVVAVLVVLYLYHPLEKRLGDWQIDRKARRGAAPSKAPKRAVTRTRP